MCFIFPLWLYSKKSKEIISHLTPSTSTQVAKETALDINIPSNKVINLIIIKTLPLSSLVSLRDRFIHLKTVFFRLLCIFLINLIFHARKSPFQSVSYHDRLFSNVPRTNRHPLYHKLSLCGDCGSFPFATQCYVTPLNSFNFILNC